MQKPTVNVFTKLYHWLVHIKINVLYLLPRMGYKQTMFKFVLRFSKQCSFAEVDKEAILRTVIKKQINQATQYDWLTRLLYIILLK